MSSIRRKKSKRNIRIPNRYEGTVCDLNKKKKCTEDKVDTNVDDSEARVSSENLGEQCNKGENDIIEDEAVSMETRETSMNEVLSGDLVNANTTDNTVSPTNLEQELVNASSYDANSDVTNARKLSYAKVASEEVALDKKLNFIPTKHMTMVLNV